MRSIFKVISIVSLFLCAIIFSFTTFGVLTIPNEIVLTENEEINIESYFVSKVLTDDRKVKSVNTEQTKEKNYLVEFSLVGLFPVKTSAVTVSQRNYVVLSGEAFGIKLYTDGVVIIGIDNINQNETTENSAKKSGLQIGDIIKEIDGVKVTRNEQVSKIFQESNGKELELKIERNKETSTIKFSLMQTTDGSYKAGIWIRDSSAGVGTMTYYNRETGVFGGLGHAVCDVDTGETMPLLDGEAIKSTISGCYKGSSGITGELCGVFSDKVIGKLLKNGDTGVYGKLTEYDSTASEVPVATKQEVETGNAQIIATVNDKGPQYFDIKIIKLLNGSEGNFKNMIIEITDEDLISITGGIVQGMSGSPIIQNGMLVGAVTHVFVNNSLQGYAIYAENMLITSNEIETTKLQNAA